MDEPYTPNRDFKSEVEAYRIENDNLKREYEKVTIDYELKIEHLKKEVNLKNVNYENLMINFQELDTKYKNSCQEKIEVNQNYFDLSQDKFNIVKKFDNLESEHATLLELISRREKELISSKNEIQELKSQLIEYRTNEIEMKLNKNDLEYRKKDFERIEQMSLSRQKKLSADITNLEEQLNESKKENFELKAHHNKIIYEMNLELDTKRNEIKNYKKLNEKLKEKNSHLEKVNEEKTESLRTAIESQSNIDNLLRKELNVQLAISELYKEERDECLSKEKNLISAITELQESLKETYEESDKIKSEFELKLNEYTQQISELRIEINSKDNELANSNELLEKFRVKGLSEEELKAMNPATASAISALKRGYSMTQIYSEYLQVVNERDELRVEIHRMNEYMTSILEELEQKAPMLKKQQEEHSDLELAVSTLAKKYDDTLSQSFSFQSELNEYRTKCEEMTKKLKRKEQTCADLGYQISCLLREIETYRGTVVRSDEPLNTSDSSFISRARNMSQRGLMNQSYSSIPMNSIDKMDKFLTAKDVITTHLVTFKNICELQQQNIHLLEQIRDLSEQQESTENLINDNSVQELAKMLERANQEIDEISEKQKQQKNLKKIVEGQRHIIQALATLSGRTDLSIALDGSVLNFDESIEENLQSLISVNDGTGDKRLSNQTHMSTISMLNGKLLENQDKIDKLQLDITKLQSEKDVLKDKHKDTTEELNRQLSDSKINNANLLSKISYNQEKTSSLEQNLINRQLDISDLQNELSEVKQQLCQKNQENKSLTSELLNCQTHIQDLESDLKRLQQNMKHIESLEEQISIEKNEKYQLIMNTTNLADQIRNLQTILIKPQLEQSVEEEIELKSRIKQLTLELKQEKSKYQNSLEAWQAKFRESSSRIDSLTSQLNTLNRRDSDTNLIISDTCTFESPQAAIEKREKTSDIESQLEDLTVSNYSLKKQVESYHSLMSNSESKLISNTELMEEMKARFQEKIDSEKQRNSEMEQLLENVQMAYEQVENECKTVKKSLDLQIEELTKKSQEKTECIAELKEEVANMKMKEAQLKTDLDRQRRLTKEANENYQQELIFHAQESDTLQELGDQMNKYKKHERELTEKLQEAVLLKNQYQSELENMESRRIEEKTGLEKEISDLRAQKDSLNNRLIDLNDHTTNLKKRLDPSIESGIDHAVIQRESDWNEVIQYLRQEKENVEKIKNQLEIDLHRFKTQCLQQEEKIQQLNNALEEERKFKILEAETSKQHAEVMRKLELTQMLTESNAMLRQDRERLKEELTGNTLKLQKLQETTEPLKSDLKVKISEIESVRLDARSLENERDLWRRRCDTLIEKSKQVNPDDFKQICMEKDQLQHQILLEEEKCKLQVTKIEEMQSELENYMKSLRDQEDQIESMKKINDENMTIIQKRDVLIIQLKDIGRKYRAETEAQKIEIDQKEEKIRELQTLKKELAETKISLEESRKNLQQYVNQEATSSSVNSVNTEEFIRNISFILQCENSLNDIIESADKVVKENQNNLQLLEKSDSEQKLRNQAIEGTMSKLKLENERMKKQLENSRHSLNATDDGDNSIAEETPVEVLQPTNSWHTVPTVARVAANVHPVVQKPQNIMSGSNQISPNSQPGSSCISIARQTAEIRPIHSVALHNVSSSTTVDMTDSTSTLSVTTSLPANVVQALAASSVSTVIFPAVTGFPTSASVTSTVSNINRLKRCFDDSNESDSRTIPMEQSSSSSSVEPSTIKKIRIRVPEQTAEVTPEFISQEVQPADVRPTTNFPDIERYDMDVCEEEVEIESEDVENIEINIADEDLVNSSNKDNSYDDTNVLEISEDYKNDNFSECDESEEDEEEDLDDVELDENDEDDDDNENGGDDGDDADDDEDDDDDENPDVIDLVSSDGGNDEANDNSVNNDKDDQNDNDAGCSSVNVKPERDGSVVDEEPKTQNAEFDQAKTKIQPIVWGDNNPPRNYLLPTNAEYVISPKLGHPIKTRNSMNITSRRKLSTPRRNYPFGSNRGMSLMNRGGLAQYSRRSGGPFKPSFARH